MCLLSDSDREDLNETKEEDVSERESSTIRHEDSTHRHEGGAFVSVCITSESLLDASDLALQKDAAKMVRLIFFILIFYLFN